MLSGRESETARIERLIDSARNGHGGALLFVGEPGIGKSALLDHAAMTAERMDILRAAGVHIEAALPYAMVHQLLSPALERVDELPAPQARALKTALGLEDGEPAEPFLVSLAALTLASQFAQERAVLCLVDDVQWADRQSLRTLSFLARRLDAEPVALVLAAREGQTDGIETHGMQVLRLNGLNDTAAAELLHSQLAGVDDPHFRGELIQHSGGNPLALLELSRSPSARQLVSRVSSPSPIPLTETLERLFIERAEGLDKPSQRFLLLAAAGEATPRATLVRAAGHFGLPDASGDLRQLGELLRIDGSDVSFRQTVMRSAIYWSASEQERRDAHRALAVAFADDHRAADRRAWHAGQASEAPDESVAAELERSALRALRRSGPLTAAATLERAAELSPADIDRGRRLVAAAGAAWRDGEAHLAKALLARAAELELEDEALELAQRHLLGEIELRAGIPADALQLLLPAARQATRVDPARAVRLLLVANEAAFNAADAEAMSEIRAVVAELPPIDDPALALVAALFRLSGRVREGAGLTDVSEQLAGAARLQEPELLLVAGGLAFGLGEHTAGRRLRVAGVARARELGAAGTLTWALEHQVTDDLVMGRFAAAEAAAREGLDLARETGRANSASVHLASLAELAALRGHEQEANERAEEALTDALDRRLVKAAGIAHRALGLLALGAGRPEEALEEFEALAGKGLALTAAPDRIEAAVRAGQPHRATGVLASFLAWVKSVQSPELRALAHRSQALLAPTDEADLHFTEALRHHAEADRPFDHARTALLYGEFLRRERRRVEARAHLRDAMEAFERLGTPVWAEHASGELRATGETARKRDPSTLDDLTPQERQIATAVSEGAANKEVAAQLFISPRTVDYHLRKVFRKLNITSRTELMRLPLTDDGQRDH